MTKLLYLLWFLPSFVAAQNPARRQAAIFEDNHLKPVVLLVGLFHFAGEQVDVNTTPAALSVNMLSPKRQQQIQHLVDKLATFRPTKIVVEVPPQQQLRYDSLFKAYTNKRFVATPQLMASETVQIGFRLAQKMGHQRVYPVDAKAFRFHLSPADSVITFEKYSEQADTTVSYWEERYDRESAFDDTLAFSSTLSTYLRYLNAPKTQARAIGRWLVATKQGSNDEPIGADGFITRYFNRNVRIFSNIQRTVTRKDDRILVLYGATHMYFLRMLFEASPEFKLEPVDTYLE